RPRRQPKIVHTLFTADRAEKVFTDLKPGSEDRRHCKIWTQQLTANSSSSDPAYSRPAIQNFYGFPSIRAALREPVALCQDRGKRGKPDSEDHREGQRRACRQALLKHRQAFQSEGRSFQERRVRQAVFRRIAR